MLTEAQIQAAMDAEAMLGVAIAHLRCSVVKLRTYGIDANYQKTEPIEALRREVRELLALDAAERLATHRAAA